VMSQNKVMVFVDGSNLFWSLHRMDLRIDHFKLVSKLVGDRFLVRPYFYSSVSVPPNQSQVRFHQALRYQGFTVVTRPLKSRQIDGKTIYFEKGLDVALATDMLVSAFRSHYDTAILVSGDDDFASIVDMVKQFGKRVEVAAFSFAISSGLKTMADKFIALDEIQEEIRLQR
jgi:uncharacterized LabA/DUF88 family protein